MGPPDRATRTADAAQASDPDDSEAHATSAPGVVQASDPDGSPASPRAGASPADVAALIWERFVEAKLSDKLVDLFLHVGSGRIRGFSLRAAECACGDALTSWVREEFPPVTSSELASLRTVQVHALGWPFAKAAMNLSSARYGKKMGVPGATIRAHKLDAKRKLSPRLVDALGLYALTRGVKAAIAAAAGVTLLLLLVVKVVFFPRLETSGCAIGARGCHSTGETCYDQTSRQPLWCGCFVAGEGHWLESPNACLPWEAHDGRPAADTCVPGATCPLYGARCTIDEGSTESSARCEDGRWRSLRRKPAAECVEGVRCTTDDSYCFGANADGTTTYYACDLSDPELHRLRSRPR